MGGGASWRLTGHSLHAVHLPPLLHALLPSLACPLTAPYCCSKIGKYHVMVCGTTPCMLQVTLWGLGSMVLGLGLGSRTLNPSSKGWACTPCPPHPQRGVPSAASQPWAAWWTVALWCSAPRQPWPRQASPAAHHAESPRPHPRGHPCHGGELPATLFSPVPCAACPAPCCLTTLSSFTSFLPAGRQGHPCRREAAPGHRLRPDH